MGMTQTRTTADIRTVALVLRMLGRPESMPDLCAQARACAAPMWTWLLGQRDAGPTAARPTDAMLQAQKVLQTSGPIAEGDRIYATEALTFDGEDMLYVPAGREGTVVRLTGDDAHDLEIEWDSGYMTGVNSGSVALVEPTVTEHDDHFGGNWNA